MEPAESCLNASGGVYLGQAADCSSTGSNTETNGCSTKSLPPGTPIYAGELVNGGIQNGTLIGTLAYNSWIAMQGKGEKDANTCAYNDLALIKITLAKELAYANGATGLGIQVATGTTPFSAAPLPPAQ